MKKLFLSIFLSFAIILYSIPCVAYASMATTSNAQLNNDEEWIGDDGELVASSSDADLVLDEQIEDLIFFSDVPMLMSSGDVDSVANTVSYSGLRVRAYYTTSSGVSGSYEVGVNSNYYFNFPEVAFRDRTITSLTFIVGKKSLPSAGNYYLSASFGSDTGGFTYNTPTIEFRKTLNNSTSAFTDKQSISSYFSQFSGDWSVSPLSIELTSVSTDIFLGFKVTGLSYPYAGYFKVRFQPCYDGNVTISGQQPASGEVQQMMQNSIDSVADNTASMNDTLKEIVGTISNQLAALWDQMFNLMHLPQLANDDKNTDRLINSGQENTEQVTGAIEEHGNFIIEGLKSLFIPSDEFFKSYFDDLYGWFSDRFGFLSFPIDLLVKFSDLILSSDETDCILTLPSFEIMGEQLLYEQSFNLTDFLEENFMFVLSALRMGTSTILIMAFVDLCGDKWDEVMKN